MAVPFLDHQLIEMVRKIPPKLFIKLSKNKTILIDKYILREAGKPFLTDEVYQAKKHPLLSPPSTVQTNKAFLNYSQDVIRSNVANVPFLDEKAVNKFLDNIHSLGMDAAIKSDLVLMRILSICLLSKIFML